MDSAPEQVFTAPFTMAAGTHTISYRSQDNAGNLETARLAAAGVTGLDTAAPTSFLDVGQPKFGAVPLFVSTATRFGLAASEPATISYAVDAEAFRSSPPPSPWPRAGSGLSLGAPRTRREMWKR